jgi:hypothetical protein
MMIYTKHFTKKNTYNVSQRSPAHHKQCSVPQAELTVCFLSQPVSTCLSLHILAASDWAHMPVVFVMITFSCPHCV